jgi:hypothetical protein
MHVGWLGEPPADCQLLLLLLPDVRRCTYLVLLVFMLAIGPNKKQPKASVISDLNR